MDLNKLHDTLFSEGWTVACRYDDMGKITYKKGNTKILITNDFKDIEAHSDRVITANGKVEKTYPYAGYLRIEDQSCELKGLVAL